MNVKAMVSMCALTVASVACAAANGLVSLPSAADHVRTIEGFVLSPDEGLLIGNGDLSASAYQNDKGIVLRLGKSDVWDRRMNFTDTQRPYTIKEYTDFVLGRKPFDPKGQKPDSLSRWPYPCPKPTGEFTLRLPPDFGPPRRFTQTLTIERNAIDFHAEWPCGLVVDATAVIPPGENALVVKYNVLGLNERTRFAHVIDQAAVWATLERKADPDPREWINRFITDWRYEGMRKWVESGATPLPPPTAWRTNGVGCIEQAFYPDKLFPEGFRYRMTLKATPALRAPWVGSRPGMKDAAIHFLPTERQTAGEIVVHVMTSRDKSLEAPKVRTFAEYAAEAEKDARMAFRTGLSFPDDPSSGRKGDRFLEDLWYVTLHARRSICRRGAISPGLFFPSSLGDISVWHSDWHANYNFASIYYGDFTANQIDVADCYVDAAAMFLPIGRKIARDYYGCRGAMIQLEGFPTIGEDDHHSTLTLGRLVYMTGWFAERHLEYWKYTRDDDWLRKKGYPFIKECALFYLDFLKKAPHPDLPTNATAGAYHAFPSVQNERSFRPETAIADHLNANGVINHVQGGLISAIDASKVLGVDEELRAQWEDRLANLVRPARPKRQLNPEDAYKRHCSRSGERYFSPYPRPWEPEKKDWKPSSAKPTDWYPGIQYGGIVGNIRDNRFIAERDFPVYRAMLEKWTHPNGLVWAMAIQGYGRQGAWTESLACVAPLQEMLMTSWDGAIRLFPRWLKDRDVAFTRWRAEGAFLVSATQRRGQIAKFEIESEKGLPCHVHGEWQVFDSAGRVVPTRRDEFGRLTFDTIPNGVYHLKDTNRETRDACGSASASNLELGHPFSDNMVLQRDMPVRVWGWADAGAEVRVSFAGQTVAGKAAKDGFWRVELKPMEACAESRSLVVASPGCADVTVTNVLVGEVWFASGQSNMEMGITGDVVRYRDVQGRLVTQWTRHDGIRIAGNPKLMSGKPLRRRSPRASWGVLGPDNVDCSALAWYYAVELHAALKVPVGIVVAAWGGSRIEPFIPPEGFAATGLKAGASSKWNSMVNPWTPMSMRGFIWYQGCSNMRDKQDYGKMMDALYKGWSLAFENPKLHLNFVQLAPWGDASIAEMQEIQDRYAKSEPNATMAVVNDSGNIGDIHPSDKETVAKRLVALALKHDYGFDIKAESPGFRAARASGDLVEVSFDDAEFLYDYPDKSGSRCKAFELAGEDGVFKTAEIVNYRPYINLHGGCRMTIGSLIGSNVYLRATGVAAPRKVRYLHVSPWDGQMFNEVGLPLKAFCEDVSPADDKLRINWQSALMERRNATVENMFGNETSIMKFKDKIRVVDGTNIWTDAINAALMDSQVVRIPASTEPYCIDGTLVVPSCRKILAEGATIRMMGPCGTALMRNAGAADGATKPVARPKGDQRIFLLGGRWEDWRARCAGKGNSALIHFGDVKTLTLRGLTIAHAGEFAIQCGDAEDVIFEDIEFTGCGGEGFRSGGNVRNVIVRNVRGDVGGRSATVLDGWDGLVEK